MSDIKDILERPYSPEVAAKIIDESRNMSKQHSETDKTKQSKREREGQRDEKKGWFARRGS